MDEVLADVRRMKKERREAESAFPPISSDSASDWSLTDIDRLLGLDDILEGISASDYAGTEPEDTPEPPHPATVGVGRHGQEFFEGLTPVYHKPEPEPEAPLSEMDRNIQALEEMLRRAEHPAVPTVPEPKPARPEIDIPMDTETPRQTFVDIFSNGRRKDPEPSEDRTPVPPSRREIPTYEEIPLPADTSAHFAEPDDGKTKTVVMHNTPVKPSHPRTGAQRISEQAEEVDGQMLLDGFNPNGARVQRIDEKVAEIQVNHDRSVKLEEFNLDDLQEEKHPLEERAEIYTPDYPDDMDDFLGEKVRGVEGQHVTPHSDDEYRNLNDEHHILRLLRERRRSAFFGTCGILLLEIALIVLAFFEGSVSPEIKPYLGAAGLVLLSIAAAISISELHDGFRNLFRFKPDCNSAATLAVLITIIHSIVGFVLPDSPGIFGTFCAATVFSLLLSKIAKLLETDAIVKNFTFVSHTHRDELYAIRPFARAEDSFDIGKNLLSGKTNLRYSQKTDFPANFVKRSVFQHSIDRLCRFILPISLATGLISALIGWITTKNGLAALTGFTASLCITLPIGSAITVLAPITLLMSHLNLKGGMIVSPSAAAAHSDISAIVLNSETLYDTLNLEGYARYSTVLQENVILQYAGALALSVGGTLGALFGKHIDKPNLLPPVKDAMYEEKLGLSGKINGQTVLLGNRNLLSNHSISPPPKSVETDYLQQGLRVLYLAVDSKVAAIFVLEYLEKDELIPFMQVLQNNDISMLVSAPDCNLTPEFLSQGFDLRQGIIHPLGSQAIRTFRQRTQETSTHAQTDLMHDGSVESLVRTLAGAVTMVNTQQVASVTAIFGLIIGWLISVILMLSKGLQAFNWQFILGYTALWTIISICLGMYQVFRLIQPDLKDLRALRKARKMSERK